MKIARVITLLAALVLALPMSVPIAVAAAPTPQIAIKSLPNIAALKTLGSSLLQDGTSYQVLGYYAANDGGGGTYVWNSASTAADNGGTVIQATGAATGRWVFQGIPTVKTFGAYGDGIHDDYAAIVATISALPSSGGTVFFPAGNYLKKSTLTITGTGTVLAALPGAAVTITDQNPAAGSDAIVFFSSVTYHAFNGIRNIFLNANTGITRYGVALYDQGRFLMSGGGIAFCKVPVYANLCELCTFDGVSIESDTAASSGGCGVSINNSTTTFELIGNCLVEGSGDGIFVDNTSSCSANGIVIESNGRYGVYCNGSFNGYNIHFEGNADSSVFSDWTWSGGASPAVISLVDCKLLGPVGGTVSYAIQTDFCQLSVVNSIPSNCTKYAKLTSDINAKTNFANAYFQVPTGNPDYSQASQYTDPLSIRVGTFGNNVIAGTITGISTINGMGVGATGQSLTLTGATSTITGGTGGLLLVASPNSGAGITLQPTTSGHVIINPTGTNGSVLDLYQNNILQWENYIDTSSGNAFTIRDAVNGANVFVVKQGSTGAAQVRVQATTPTTSPTTGALVVSGGAGIAGDVNVGGITVIGHYTVATLPAPVAYGECFVSDATQAAGTGIGTAPTGGGAVKRKVYSDGVSWILE